MGICESSFAVTADEEHVFGISSENDQKAVVMEPLSDAGNNSEPKEIITQDTCICAVILLEKARTLLVGDEDGRVTQYRLDANSLSCRLERTYQVPDFEYVCAGLVLGHLVVFGGSSDTVFVIDAKKQEVLGGQYSTAIREIYSLRAVSLSSRRTLLAVSGANADYSRNSTDILDITALLRHHGVRPSQLSLNESFSSGEEADDGDSERGSSPCTAANAFTAQLTAKIERYVSQVVSEVVTDLVQRLTACKSVSPIRVEIVYSDMRRSLVVALKFGCNRSGARPETR